MPETRATIPILFIAVLIAFALDIGYTMWARKRLARGGAKERQNGGVFLFGVYSPTLSWASRTIPTIPAQGRGAARQIFVGIPALIREIARQIFVGVPTVYHWLARRKHPVLELGFVFLAVLAFCSIFLNFSSDFRLQGNESIIFQTLDWTLYNSLTKYHAFPLWNPYLQNGIPYIADPMTHVFNPLVTLPVLLMGVESGFKMGVFLSFVLAAFGMWRLGKILGVRDTTRIWMALMYVFAGQPAARFFQGQYLFVFGFAWIPWVIGSLMLLVRTRKPRYVVGASFSLALLFFSGNLYYQFYIAGACLLFTLISILKISRKRPYLRVDLGAFKLLLAVGLLSFGLVAVQMLPTMEIRNRLVKTTEIAGAQTLGQVLLDFTSKDSFRADAYSVLPAREEFYAYIGWLPLLSLASLGLVWLKREWRKPALFFLLLLVGSLLWTNIISLPGGRALMSTFFFSQFRHLLRVLIIAIFAIILLAGMGLDAMQSRLLQPRDGAGEDRGARMRKWILRGTGVILIAGMFLGVYDVYRTNRKVLHLEGNQNSTYPAVSWLSRQDTSQYYVRFNPNNTTYDVLLKNDLNFIQAWYHFANLRSYDGNIARVYMEAQPNYIIQGAGDTVFDEDAVFLAEVDGYSIYRREKSLPFAFIVDSDMLFTDTLEWLAPKDVAAMAVYKRSPNHYEVITDREQEGYLTLLMTHYPGWKVLVDGTPGTLVNISGYLGTPLLPGVHKYEFIFQPASVMVGLIISLASMLGSIGYLVYRRKWTLSEVTENAGVRLGRLQGSYATFISKIHAASLQAGALKSGEMASQGELRITRESVSVWVWDALRRMGLAGTLFAVGMAVVAFTRLYALDRFPVYFFADEAVQALYGETLIQQGFKDANGSWLPMYVEAAPHRWTPLLPMYIHALTLTLFGKSIFVVRGTSALVGLLASLSAALMMKYVFKAKRWWAAALLIGATPAWLLHSRTAFETVMTTAFYGCFLLAYLLYRTRSPKFIYWAVIFGALTFYTYSNAQLIIVACGILLFLSDLPYHLSQRKHLVFAILLLVIVAVPLIAFQLNQPGAMGEHLSEINSYWKQNTPLAEKISTFFKNYFYALSPRYWFTTNGTDLPRHRWATIGQIHWLAAPFILIGILVCLYRIKKPEYRTVLLAVLATPVGAALAQVGITRVLAVIVPAGLLAAIGIEWLLDRLKEKPPAWAVSTGLFAVLAGANLLLFRSALANSPLWFSDYGLYGIQYGARQLFVDTIPQILEEDPQAKVIVTSAWANGADAFLRFFFTPAEQTRVLMGGVDTYIRHEMPIDPHVVFVMTAAEYQQAVDSLKFKPVQIDTLIEYPDGTPGFYLVHLEYIEGVSDIFKAEKEARMQLMSSEAVIDGSPVSLQYSQTDMGDPAMMFDGDRSTLMRGLEANPYILEINFPQPRSISEIQGIFGLAPVTMTAYVYNDLQAPPEIFQVSREQNSKEELVSLPIDPGTQVVKLRLEIYNYLAGETANIHIMELKLLP